MLRISVGAVAPQIGRIGNGQKSADMALQSKNAGRNRTEAAAVAGLKDFTDASDFPYTSSPKLLLPQREATFFQNAYGSIVVPPGEHTISFSSPGCFRFRVPFRPIP